MSQTLHLDPIGEAIHDFYTHRKEVFIKTVTDCSESEKMPVSYLFRPFEKMPPIEQTALKHSFGKVLDIGCGAGSHALYLQNEKKLKVLALDISEKSVEVCRKRGVDEAIVFDIKNYDRLETLGTFDTLLLLMNGTGIFGTIQEFTKALKQLKKLLNKGGQLLIDSSDIRFLFEETQDGGLWIPSAKAYYGELIFTVSYKKQTVSFPWVYIDSLRLKKIAEDNGFDFEMLQNGEHFDYLAKLTIKKPGEPG